MLFNGVRYIYLKNAQGDITGIRSEADGSTKYYEYDEWGDRASISSPDDHGVASAIVYNPLRYRGYVYDQETGFYYLNSRYYNPLIGRFLNADDSSVLIASMDMPNFHKNLFAYCDGEPNLRVDGDGEFWHFLVGAVVGAVIGTATQLIVNITTGEEDWSKGLGTAALTGAASGALAASGVGLIGAIVGSGTISMMGNATNQVIENNGFNDKFDASDMFADGLVGAAAGAIGGPGMTSTNNITTLNNNLTKKVFSGSAETAVRGAKYYASQTLTRYKRDLFSPIIKSGIVVLVYGHIKFLNKLR